MKQLTRYSLGALLAFAALNSFGGGYYGMSGAVGVPLEWLEGTPFKDYFIPSLILFILVGIPFLYASIAVFAGWKHAAIASNISVLIVGIWLVVEMIMIGYVSWMQPVTALVGIMLFYLTWMYSRYDVMA